jgi:zinc/manganese transport system permease protein
MTDFLHVMLYPFLACLVLSSILAYLGLHVIERGVIFVDLALAQIAALGTTVGIVIGLEPNTAGSYWLALSFTFVGAMIFSVTRLKHSKVPHEAVIGSVYVVAAAAAILVLTQSHEGDEELKNIMIGRLLFVQQNDLLKLLLIYGAIGLVHWFIRKPLLLISQRPQEAFQQGIPIKWWDFLFYTTFGFVVTSSVELAGVLLVFAFLVIPSICAAWLAHSVKQRLLLGWFLGVVMSTIGIAASYWLDFPTGATVVCVFGIGLAICMALRAIRGQPV